MEGGDNLNGGYRGENEARITRSQKLSAKQSRIGEDLPPSPPKKENVRKIHYG